MEATKIGARDPRVKRRAAPRRHPARADRVAFDVVGMLLLGILVTIALLAVVGMGAELSAQSLPVGGPVPGFP